MTYKVINAIPATKVEANVYQLYMVLYQCASILISHNQGVVDITVKPNQTRNNEAQIVFLKMYFLPSSTDNFPDSSNSLLILLILAPRKIQPTMLKVVQTIKNV